MTAPAARAGDGAICPMHGATEIESGSANVFTNGRLQARASDVCVCGGGVTTTISRGSSTVRINNLQTAHAGLVVGHGGKLAGCSPNVNIGGPDGATAGPVGVGAAACKALAAGRTSGSSAQSYGNCEVETLRQMINAERARQGLPPLTEDEALAIAQQYGASKSDDPNTTGGMMDSSAQAMMAGMGYPVDVRDLSQEQLAQIVESGTPVGVGTHCRYWWGSGVGEHDAHEILVTGVERDANGNIVGFIVNDTGLGRCGMFIPAAVLENARRLPDGSGHDTAVVPEKSPFR